MANYIDLETAEYRLEKMASIEDNHGRAKGIRSAIRALHEMITSAELEPVRHGLWILKHIGAGHMYECSCCHKQPCIYITDQTNYCPNCGAKMDL